MSLKLFKLPNTSILKLFSLAIYSRMADREEIILHTVRMRRNHAIMAFVLIILYLLETATSSPPSETIMYPGMGTALFRMLNYAPDEVWKDLFRLDRGTFCQLEQWLAINTTLGTLGGMPLRRKLMIFLLVIGHGFTIRVVGEFAGCSCDTAHRLVLIKI